MIKEEKMSSIEEQTKRNESGVRTRVKSKKDIENRNSEFSDWHRTALSRKCYTQDLDYVQYRIINGKRTYVGVFEVTKADEDQNVSYYYLNAIRKRYNKLGGQGETAKDVAAALKCQAYNILFRKGCKEFWVRNLVNDRGWVTLTPEMLIDFIENLTPSGVSKIFYDKHPNISDRKIREPKSY